MIPAYNEAKNIEQVIRGVKARTDAFIFVIDDGSKDDTARIASKAGAYVIRHPFNMGYGVALQTGYKFATAHGFDILLQMDGDGQHLPESIPVFFETVASGRYDVLIGSRFLGSGGYNPGLLKQAGIFLFKLIIRMINGARITDPTSGFQCMNRDVFEIFTDDSFPCDYPDTNIIIRLHRMGFRVGELPVDMRPNPEGRAMHKGVFKILYYFFTMFLSIFITMISRGSYFRDKAKSR